MHKYIVLFFSVLLFLISCKSNKLPPDIISHNRMVSLLTDIHIVDGALVGIDPSPDSLYKYATGDYLVLFKRYKTDSVQFKKSYKYYAVHSAELLAMYEQVMKNLKQKSDSITKISQKPVNAVPHK